MASGVTFEEIECKTIINSTNTPGLGFRWSINPYRGCQHACVYCFARGTHEYLGYDAGRDFESPNRREDQRRRCSPPTAAQAELEARTDRARHRLRPLPAGRNEVRDHPQDPRSNARLSPARTHAQQVALGPA